MRSTESQVIEDFNLLEIDETEEEILADEARWDAQFAATQEGLKKMAEKVRAEISAGRSMPMVFTKDENARRKQGTESMCARKHTPHAISGLDVDCPKRRSDSANGVRLWRYLQPWALYE